MTRSAILLAAGLAGAVLPILALADDPPASPLTYNLGAVSDYRYRGITQSKFEPALQGGVDYASGPAYAGTWLSTIAWVKDAGRAAGIDSGNAPVEWDVYGGLRGDVVKDALSCDVGGLAYVYLGQKFHDIGLSDPDTFEVYGALTAGVFTAKVSVSATPLFGTPHSRGSQYYDFTANLDLGGGFSLTPELAYQNVTGRFFQDAGLPDPSYALASATLGKDFGKGLTASLQVVGTDAHRADYQTSGGKFTGRAGVVAGLKYSF